MAHWLVKTEPGTWSWAMHWAKPGRVEPWTGVRNHQAAIHLRAMKAGDEVFFYHTGDERQVVGVCSVVREAYPDPTDEAGRFVAVDLRAERALGKPVTLAQVKADPKLADMPLVRFSRLSVMPVAAAAWKRMLAMAQG